MWLAEYSPNREICLPELLFSEIVPTRDPRLSAICPASSIYFDMAKAFAKGIPPEDWYENGPDEGDWIDRAKKLLVHLPANSLYRPENKESTSCAETSMEDAVMEDLIVSAADQHSSATDVTATERAESRDSDSDDERISRVIQSCMEPLVVNVKTEPSDDGDELGHASVDSPTVRSTMAMTEGKAQRLLKLKQSGISPEMLRRRLQKIEEKLSALRSRRKSSTDVPLQGNYPSASESRSVDIDDTQPVSKHVDEDIPQKQSDISVPSTSGLESGEQSAEYQELIRTTIEASCVQPKKPRTDSEDVAVGMIGSSDGLTRKLNVDATSGILREVVSEPLSRSSKHLDHVEECAAVLQQQNTVSDPRLPLSPHKPAVIAPRTDDAGSQIDASHDLPWYVGYLSLDTKWDSQFIESQAVSRTLLEAMRNWRLRKPLDLIMSGQLRDVPLDWTPMKTTWKTDSTVDCCWNSVLWYFGALLGEPTDSCGQQSMSSLSEDARTNGAEVLPEDASDDWWGIGSRDEALLPSVGPVRDSQKAGKSSLLSSEKQGVSLPEMQKSCHSAVEPSVENTAPKPVDSVVSPSDKVIAAPTVDVHRKSSSRSAGSHKDKSKCSDVQKSSESSSSRGGAEPSSDEKRKRKHEDRKKSKHGRLAADSSSKPMQSVKDSRVRDQDTEKENKTEQDTKKEDKRTANDKEREKHTKKVKKHKRDAGDAEDKVKEHLESAEGTSADIADLLRLLVGSDEKKLSLLSKAIGNVKQFNSHKLTTSTSLHWAVALALLDENLLDKDAVVPESLRFDESEQQPDRGTEAQQLNSNKSVATESSVKGVFDSVSDFMNDILSGKSTSDVSDTKSGAANGLSASHLDELRYSESDKGPTSSQPNSKMQVVGNVKVKVENELADDTNCVGPKVNPVPTSAEATDDVVVVEEMKKIKVDRRTIGKQRFVLPDINKNQKVLVSRQVGSADTVKVQVDSEHKQREQKTGDGNSDGDAAKSDDGEDVSAKRLRKWSSIVGKALISLRDEHTRLADRKGARHHHHNKKETSGHADKGTVDSSTSRQSSTKSKQSSGHPSQHEKSKHSRHEKKNRSHDRHKKSSRSDRQTSRDRTLTSSFETISDTELEGQSTSVNDDRASRTSKQQTRVSRKKADAGDKAKTDVARANSANKTASRPDKNVRSSSNDKTSSVVPTEKLPMPLVSTSQSTVASSSGSSSTVSHITYCPSNIFKMAIAVPAAPVKTATTDMFLASRGPRFMQTFRRSQIAKRRIQRESQQTATGGKLLTTSHRPPSSMILSKPVVRPIGLSLEATLAAFSTSTATSQSHTSAPEDSSAVASLSGSATSLTAAVSTLCPLSTDTSTDAQKSPFDSTVSASDVTAPFLAADSHTIPPLPASPEAAGGDGAPPLPEGDPCDSRTTSVAGSPPPDLSLLCGDSLLTNVVNRISVVDATGSLSDGTPSFGSVYPTTQVYGSLSSTGSASEQFFGQNDFGSPYWMMPSYGAYGYESSMYGSAYAAWYYGQAWNPSQHPSCDVGYGSYPPQPVPPPPDNSFSAQQELASPWSMFSPSSMSYGPDPQFPSSTPPEIPLSSRLRAPPRLSSDDDPAWLPKSPLPLLHLPFQTPTDAIPSLIPPGNLARFTSSGEESASGHAIVSPQKKRFLVYSNNSQLRAEVTVSYVTCFKYMSATFSKLDLCLLLLLICRNCEKSVSK